MIRFFRMVLMLLGGLVVLITLLRALQPSETEDTYKVIYGNLNRSTCCVTYMIDEGDRRAHRVQIGLTQQDRLSNLSPSAKWRFARVLLSAGADYRVYLIPTDGSDPTPLEWRIAQSWYMHWNTESDILYYFARERDIPAALYRLTPDNPSPQRLTGFMFDGVRTINQQALPKTNFYPAVPFIWGVLAFAVGYGMKIWRQDRLRFRGKY